MAIKTDCKWFAIKYVSLGDLNWCVALDEELIEDAQDCTDCDDYKPRLKKEESNANSRSDT